MTSITRGHIGPMALPQRARITFGAEGNETPRAGGPDKPKAALEKSSLEKSKRITHKVLLGGVLGFLGSAAGAFVILPAISKTPVLTQEYAMRREQADLRLAYKALNVNLFSADARERMNDDIQRGFRVYLQQVSSRVAGHTNPEAAVKEVMENLPLDRADRERTLAFFHRAAAGNQLDDPVKTLETFLTEEMGLAISPQVSQTVRAELRKFQVENQAALEKIANAALALLCFGMLLFYCALAAGIQLDRLNKQV